MSNPFLAQALDTVVGVILAKPDQAATILSQVRGEDLPPPHRQIVESVNQLRINKVDIEPLSVADEMRRRGTLSRAGGLPEIHRIFACGFGDPAYSIEVINTATRLTRLQNLAIKTEAAAAANDAEPLLVAKGVVEQAQAIVDGIEAEGEITTPSLGEFLATDDPPHDWVVPGLLERGDRLILTGSEGLGKSVLQRQLAVAAASGVHPFTHEQIPPVRVLYVDCENGPVKLRRALRPLVHVGQRQGSDPSSRMWLEAIPQGLDLTRPEDEAWLVRLASNLQPDLLLTGPIYRLHAANPNDEEPARKVTAVLDRCRIAANCALVTEAHAGHGFGGDKRPIRPTGSSLWLRWPEFGYGLRAADNYDPHNRVVDFTAWRGDREERDWPKRLRSGGTWPWVADNPHPYDLAS